MLLLVGAGFLVGRHLAVRSVVIRSSGRFERWREHAPDEIDALGGEEEARQRLLTYATLPEWVAPERLHAKSLLTQCGEDACRGLYNIVKGSDRELASKAREALTWTRDARAIGFFAEILGTDEDPRVRMMAVAALGFIDDERVLVPIVKALARDEDQNVRKNAALALGNLGDPRGIEALQGAMRDRSPWVRQHAQEALEKIKAAQKETVEKPTPPE